MLHLQMSTSPYEENGCYLTWAYNSYQLLLLPGISLVPPSPVPSVICFFCCMWLITSPLLNLNQTYILIWLSLQSEDKPLSSVGTGTGVVNYLNTFSTKEILRTLYIAIFSPSIIFILDVIINLYLLIDLIDSKAGMISKKIYFFLFLCSQSSWSQVGNFVMKMSIWTIH